MAAQLCGSIGNWQLTKQLKMEIREAEKSKEAREREREKTERSGELMPSGAKTHPLFGFESCVLPAVQ